MKNLESKEVLNVSLEVYDGPLDALYTQIVKKQIEISKVSISDLIFQFLDFIKENKDMEISGEFLEMATKLLYIKSSFLLRKKVEEDSEEEIANKLLEKLNEYKLYRDACDELFTGIDGGNKSYYRGKPEITVIEDFVLENFDLNELYQCLIKLITTELAKKEDLNIKDINDKKLEKIYASTKTMKIEDGATKIREFLFGRNDFELKELISEGDKEFAIVTFLALLELCKAKEITLEQASAFDDIKVIKNKEVFNNDAVYTNFEEEYYGR